MTPGSIRTLSLSDAGKKAKRRVVLTVMILMVAVPFVVGQKKPNFSGRWELDYPKSQLRPTKWNSLAMVIDHQEPQLKIDMILKYPHESDFNYQIPLTTTGRETKVDMGKNTRIYHATWVGATLTIKWNEDGDRKEIWTLSPDGKVLTIVGSAKLTNNQSEAWKYVMVKK